MNERESLLLNGMWRMAPDPRGDGEARGCMLPSCDDRRWREAPVPSVFEHDCPEIDYYRGQCWYRRRFIIPATWQGRRVVLRFGGLNDRASAWLNGVKLGESPDPFLPVEFELGEAANYGGENLLAVVVDNRPHPGAVPGMHVGWRIYGGILRDVTLAASATLYLDNLHVLAEPEGRVTCRLRICNAQPNAVTATPAVTIADAAGAVLALSGAPVALAPGQAADVTLEGTIPDVIPWSPETPHLYTATASLDGGDAVSVRIGARRIAATPDGLLLNGAPIFLTGFNRHEDSPRTAMAVDPEMTRRDLEGMLAAGANCVRLCHYPHDPHELDLCDELGLVVFAEVPLYFWNDVADGRQHNAARTATTARQLERMIRRDRNHPSIIVWSVSNETNEDEAEPSAANRELIRLAKALDPTRLCTHVSSHWQDAPNFSADDVICVNGYPSTDWEAIGCSDAFRDGRSGDVWRAGLATLRAQYPDKPILITEFGFSSFIGTDGHDFDEATHARVLEMEFAGLDAPYLCGALIWCWADHAWDPKRFHGGLIISPFGVVSRDRRPKAALATATRLFRDRQATPAPAPAWPGSDAILMHRPHLRDIPAAPFPDGYGIRAMSPEDVGLWVDVQRDAEPYLTIDAALFYQQFGHDPSALRQRCFLITDPRGLAVGTISAWQHPDVYGEAMGQVHWVSVRPAEQGKGLAKAALRHALTVMAQWHACCFLQTSPERLGAIKIYLDFGFLPDLRPAHARTHWRAIQARLGHPALAALEL